MPRRDTLSSREQKHRFRIDVYMPSAKHVAVAHAVIELMKRDLDLNVLKPSLANLMPERAEEWSAISHIIKNQGGRLGGHDSGGPEEGANAAPTLVESETGAAISKNGRGGKRQETLQKHEGDATGAAYRVAKEVVEEQSPTALFWVLVSFGIIVMFLGTLTILFLMRG